MIGEDTGLSSLKIDKMDDYISHCKSMGIDMHLTQQEIKVKFRSANSVLEEYFKDRIDLLIIDCEGLDYEILKSINFDKYQPKLIVVEYEDNKIINWQTQIDKFDLIVAGRYYRIAINERNIFYINKECL